MCVNMCVCVCVMHHRTGRFHIKQASGEVVEEEYVEGKRVKSKKKPGAEGSGV